MKINKKMGRNDYCPCGSGKKYKKCCIDKKDWNKINNSEEHWKVHATIKERNIQFLAYLWNILDMPKDFTLLEYKEKFTDDVIQKIYSAILKVWPTDSDIMTILGNISENVSGIYIGDYESGYIEKGIIRHCLYADKILIIDPLLYPRPELQDQISPILNPYAFRTDTFKWVYFWMKMAPWIESDLIQIIRSPSDFDLDLLVKSRNAQNKTFESNPNLKEAAELSVEEFMRRHEKDINFRHQVLNRPDSMINKEWLKSLGINKKGVACSDLLKKIQDLRDTDVNLICPCDEDGKPQYESYTLGANYYMASLIANQTKSYIVTDQHVVWKQLELNLNEDRKDHCIRDYEPFAKAFQNIQLSVLNNVSLKDALRLRTEEPFLLDFRHFLKKLWKDCKEAQPFSDQNADRLLQELTFEINKAQQEWKQIDKGVTKNLFDSIKQSLVGIGIGTGSAILSSNFECLIPPVGQVVQNVISKGLSTKKAKETFFHKCPAGFFMDIKE